MSFQLLTGLYLLLAKRAHKWELPYFWQTIKFFRASVLNLEEMCSTVQQGLATLTTKLPCAMVGMTGLHIEVMQKEGNTG